MPIETPSRETIDVRDCVCGLRYARHRCAAAEMRYGAPFCRCGRLLETWRGRFNLDYEPEERTGYLH